MGFAGNNTFFQIWVYFKGYWLNFVGLWGVGEGFPHRFKGFNLGCLFLVEININRSQLFY